MSPVDGPHSRWNRTTVEQTKDGVYWPTVWGLISVPAFLGGTRMAPNGVAFNPIFAIGFDFNLGLYNQRTVYLFMNNDFWAQRAGAGVTNSKQGSFDFSKREYDLNVGVAYNYWDNFEARVYAYSLNNLNRGNSLSSSFGYQDGVALENRYYIGDIFYDVARRSFVAVGYMPTRQLVGGDGQGFRPSLYARVKLAQDIIEEVLYVSVDSQLICQRPESPKLLWVDAGISYRPFTVLPGLEFRLGSEETDDLQVHIYRNLWYLAIRFVF